MFDKIQVNIEFFLPRSRILPRFPLLAPVEQRDKQAQQVTTRNLGQLRGGQRGGQKMHHVDRSSGRVPIFNRGYQHLKLTEPFSPGSRS